MSWLRRLLRRERDGSAPMRETTRSPDRAAAERLLSEVRADDQEIERLSATLRKRERENHLGPMIMRALRGGGGV